MATFEDAIDDFLSELDAGILSTADREAARVLLTDQLGVQVGLADLPWSEQATAAALDGAPDGKATIVANGLRVDPETAAFCNASYAHGFEYDDAHSASDGHPGSVTVSVALALAEAEDRTLAEAVVAIVAGYEVYTRIGTALSPALLARGWHPHAVLAPFGAAATAATIEGLSSERTRHALAIAASHASGITEYSSTGGSVKRVHAGIGAQNGIRAVRLASRGVTGPDRYLTGNKGAFRAFAGVEPPGPDPETFGRERLEIHDTWLKLHSCCGCTHAYLDCLDEIDPASDPDRIDRVEARVQPSTDSIVGTQNENLYEPTSIEEAQFNLPFELALAILGWGNGVESHRALVAGDRRYDDPALRATMDRIELRIDRELERYDPAFVGDLTVEYVDGTTEEAFVEHARGTPGNPASAAERRRKFDELTEPILGSDQASELWSVATDAPLETPVRELRSLIAPP